MTSITTEPNYLEQIRAEIPSIIRVLLIDEQPLSQRLVAKYLQEIDPQKYQVICFDTYEEALNRLLSNDYEIALIDHLFPAKKKGLDLIQTALAKGCQKPMILLIPDKKKDYGREALAGGATDCLVKTKLSAFLLERAIEHAIQGTKLRELFTYRVQVHDLLAKMAASFINCRAEQVDSAILEALRMIGEFADADRCYIFLFGDDNSITMTHEWCRGGIDSVCSFYNNQNNGLLAPLVQFFRNHSQFPFTDLNLLPPEGSGLKNAVLQHGAKSMLVYPLQSLNRRLGLLGLTSIRKERTWNKDLVTLVELSSQVLVSALEQKKSEQRFRRYFDLPLVGIALSSIDKRWLEVNDKLCSILGYTREELVGRSWLDITHPEDIDNDYDVFNDALRRELDCYTLDKRFLRKDGTVVPVELSVGIIRNHGKIEYFIVLLNDLSARLRDQAALEEQQEYLRQVIDIIPHHIFAKDAQGRFTLVNRASARDFGQPIEKIIGKTDADLNPRREDVIRYQNQDQRIFESGRPIVIPENPIHLVGTGDLHWFHTIKSPLRTADGKVTQVLGVSTDLTERKRAEDALRAIMEGTASETAQDFFRSLVFHLASVLNTKCAFVARISRDDPRYADMLTFYMDGAFQDNYRYRIQGTPSETVIGKSMQHYPEKAFTQFPLDKFLTQNQIESYIGAPLFNSTGKPLGVLAVMHNKVLPDWVPQRWIMSIFAARAGAELERLMAEEEKQVLQRQLLQSQKMEVLGTLAAGIAHDFNNSLSAVRGHLELIKICAALTPDLSNSVEIALQGCERASALIQQLLGFSRIKSAKIEKVSLPLVLAQTTEFLSRLINKKVVLETRGSADGLMIEGDAGQIQQALTNLIINSNQAMPEGGKITFEFNSREIENVKPYNPAAKPGRYATLAVTDTGCGISKENLERIFEPFFTTKVNSGGTGLGLSTVYRIVQQHNGWIDVTSQIGSGTCFTLYLPCPPAEAAPAPALAPAKCKTAGTVLVVDDEPFLVELCLAFLSKSGYAARGFTSPAEALSWYKDHYAEVSLVILDLKMPVVNGEDCFHQLKQINKDVKAIVLSGYIQDATGQRLIDQGIVKYFQKPLKYPELMHWIGEQLSSAGEKPAH